ncbi:MAG: pimeloyl-ACP methyl ester carboxylesterase, partial [Myxococcota bacterium]
EFAVRAPHRVAGIIGFGPALFADERSGRRLFGRMGWSTRLFASDNVMARSVCRVMCRHRNAAANLAERLRSDLPPEIARDGVRHTWASYSGTLRHMVLESGSLLKMASIGTPVELIIGDDDPVCAHLVQDQPQNVKVTTWEGGHHLPVSHANQCVSAIQMFLR